MTVTCNVQQCGFYDRGFCRQITLNIRDGHCGFVYTKTGAVNQEAINPIEDKYKKKLIIMEGKVNGVRCSEECVDVNSGVSENHSKES